MKRIVIIDLDNCMYDTWGTEGPKGQLYPEVKAVLEQMADAYTLVLLTALEGKNPVEERKRQWGKILPFGIIQHFHMVMMVPDAQKKFPMMYALKQIPDLVLMGGASGVPVVVGDRLDGEITHANDLGYISVHVRRGKYKSVTASSDREKPDHMIETFHALPEICEKSLIKPER